MSQIKASDGIKIDLLQQINRESEIGITINSTKKLEQLQTTLVANLSDEVLKKRLLKQINDDLNRAKIIATLDEASIREYISTIEDENASTYILSEGNVSDSLKQEYLEHIKDDTKKATILCTIQNDSVKEKYIKELDYKNQIRVIISFESDELKEDYLEEITKESDRIEIIASFHSDDVKESYFKSIKDDRDAAYIVSTFESDGMKEYYIRSLYDEVDKVAVIKSFSSDELKIKYLSEAKTQEQVAEIVESLSDDEIKIKLVEEIDDIYLKTVVMTTVKDNQTKVDFLESFRSEDFKDEYLKRRVLQVIRGLETYEDKERYASLMPLEHKAEIISTISGEEKDFPLDRVEYFEEIVDDLVYSLEDGSNLKGISMQELEIEMKAVEGKISAANDSMKKALIEKITILQRILAEKSNELEAMKGNLSRTDEENEIGGADGK